MNGSKQPAATSKAKKAVVRPTTRKVAPRRSKIRFSEAGVPHLGHGKTEYTEAPSGAILSSSHVTKKDQMRSLLKQHSHGKFHHTRGSLGRDLAAFQYKRTEFPNLIFTMLYPGKEMPADVTIFKVPMKMNRIQIKDYLEELYGVSVIKVNTAINIGKKKLNNLGQYRWTRDWKKAYVRTTDPFSYPWPRPISYGKTEAQKKKEAEEKKKEKEERDAAKAAQAAHV